MGLLSVNVLRLIFNTIHFVQRTKQRLLETRALICLKKLKGNSSWFFYLIQLQDVTETLFFIRDIIVLAACFEFHLLDEKRTLEKRTTTRFHHALRMKPNKC